MAQADNCVNIIADTDNVINIFFIQFVSFRNYIQLYYEKHLKKRMGTCPILSRIRYSLSVGKYKNKH